MIERIRPIPNRDRLSEPIQLRPADVISEYKKVNQALPEYIRKTIELYSIWKRKTLTPREVGRLVWYFDGKDPDHISWKLTQGGRARRVEQVAQTYLSLRGETLDKEWGNASLVEKMINALKRGERFPPLIIVEGKCYPNNPDSSFIDGTHRSLAIVAYYLITSDENLRIDAIVGKASRRRHFPRTRGKGNLGQVIYNCARKLHERAPKGEAYLNSRRKRAIDLIGLFPLAVIGVPTVLAEALYVARCDRTWPFYSLQCVGKDGKRFGRLKIKTMVEGARSIPGFEIPMMTKSPFDSRVLHRRLRRTSLDELPQMLNVFKGEMSLVGQVGRPPEELDYFKQVVEWEPELRGRIEKFLKLSPESSPGMTGLYQIMGRANLTLTEIALVEGWYFENASWVLDLNILLGTLLAIKSREGAY